MQRRWDKHGPEDQGIRDANDNECMNPPCCGSSSDHAATSHRICDRPYLNRSELHFWLPRGLPTVNIAVHLVRPCRLAVELIPQHTVDTHFRLALPLFRHVESDFQQVIRFRNRIDDPFLEGLLPGESMSFE